MAQPCVIIKKGFILHKMAVGCQQHTPMSTPEMPIPTQNSATIHPESVPDKR